MAEKKKPVRKPVKQTGVMMRLGEWVRVPLAEMAGKNTRTLVAEVELALKARFKEQGIAFKEE
jgi:hypothetical protein